MRFKSDLLNPNGRFEIFNYQNLGKVRVQVDNQGNPWFCLNDVLGVLNLTNISETTKRLNPDGLSSTEVIDSLGRPQNMIFVDEGNLYMAIGRSRKPEAQPFMEWIYREVLPMIRKTGMYIDEDIYNQLIKDPRTIADVLYKYADERERRIRLEEENARLRPSAQKWINWVSTDKVYRG